MDTDYSYDAASRLEELVHDLNGTSHDRTLDFSYNPAGQIMTRTDSNTTYAWTDFVNFTEDSRKRAPALHRVRPGRQIIGRCTAPSVKCQRVAGSYENRQSRTQAMRGGE